MTFLIRVGGSLESGYLRAEGCTSFQVGLALHVVIEAHFELLHLILSTKFHVCLHLVMARLHILCLQVGLIVV